MSVLKRLPFCTIICSIQVQVEVISSTTAKSRTVGNIARNVHYHKHSGELQK